jgi:hypothetical protein
MYGLTTQCFEKDLEDLFGFGLRDIVASNASKKLNKLAGYKPLQVRATPEKRLIAADAHAGSS